MKLDRELAYGLVEVLVYRAGLDRILERSAARHDKANIPGVRFIRATGRDALIGQDHEQLVLQ